MDVYKVLYYIRVMPGVLRKAKAVYSADKLSRDKKIAGLKEAVETAVIEFKQEQTRKNKLCPLF
jgi:hypothetical protein